MSNGEFRQQAADDMIADKNQRIEELEAQLKEPTFCEKHKLLKGSTAVPCPGCMANSLTKAAELLKDGQQLSAPLQHDGAIRWWKRVDNFLDEIGHAQ